MTTLTIHAAALGPLTVEVIDSRGKRVAAPQLMSSTRPRLEIPDVPAGELTVVATRPSGEQLLSTVEAYGDRVATDLHVAGVSPHEFMSEATAFGLVRPAPSGATPEVRGPRVDTSVSLPSSALAGTAGRNLAALGASPVFGRDEAATFDGLFATAANEELAAIPGRYTLASWEWFDGRWRRADPLSSNLNADSGFFQVRFGHTDVPLALGLLDSLGYGPIVIVPPFKSGIDITFLAEGLGSPALGRRLANPSAIRTPVALALPHSPQLADLLIALTAPALPRAAQLWDQVVETAGSPANDAHLLLAHKFSDPTAAILGALFLTRFAPARAPLAWLRNLDALTGDIADSAYLLAWSAMTRPTEEPVEARTIRGLLRTAQRRPLLYFSRTRAQLVQAARLYGPWTRSRQRTTSGRRQPREGDFLDFAADAGGLEAFWGASPSRPGVHPKNPMPRAGDQRVTLAEGVFTLG
jgi:hypothetical protein